MPQKPKLYQFEKTKNGKIDTVTISARRIIYNKKNAFAEAYGQVKVTQNDMVVTCDTGYFDRQNNWLSMKGHPTCDMKNYHLTGDSIFLVLDSAGKSLKSALVIRNAHGVQQEEAKRGAPGHVTEAFGDTLYAEFSKDKIERLYVNLNARGFFYEDDLKDYRNSILDDIVESISDCADVGADIGESLGGLFGSAGRAVGRVAGRVVGGAFGAVKSIAKSFFGGIFGW